MSTICMDSAAETVLNKNIKLSNDALNVLVGPEGGWHLSDLASIQCQRFKIGSRILRADTAAILSVGIIQFLKGDLSTN